MARIPELMTLRPSPRPQNRHHHRFNRVSQSAPKPCSKKWAAHRHTPMGRFPAACVCRQLYRRNPLWRWLRAAPHPDTETLGARARAFQRDGFPAHQSAPQLAAARRTATHPGRRFRRDYLDAPHRKRRHPARPHLPKGLNQAQQWDSKTYGIGAQILANLNVKKMRVLGKPSSFTGLTGFGLEVARFEMPDEA